MSDGLSADLPIAGCCGIYESRPGCCAEFECSWLETSPGNKPELPFEIPAHWKPSEFGIVLETGWLNNEDQSGPNIYLLVAMESREGAWFAHCGEIDQWARDSRVVIMAPRCAGRDPYGFPMKFVGDVVLAAVVRMAFVNMQKKGEFKTCMGGQMETHQIG